MFILDYIISKLERFTALNHSSHTDLEENCIKWLIKESKTIFKREPNLLELSAPINICGDFHG